MKRLSLLLALLVALLAGALGATWLNRGGLDEAHVRAIAAEVATGETGGLNSSTVKTLIAEALASQPKPQQSDAVLDPAKLNPMIEDYLMKNPRLLQRVSAALQAELSAEKTAKTREALAELKPAIYDDPDQVVLGNPKGDVTLVELFDYNCGYCRQALPDLATLLDEDKNLRVILKEFPILSPESAEAARVGVLVSESPVDYWNFHQTLFSSRGKVGKTQALQAAASLGLNPITLEMKMGDPKVTAAIDKSYDIARKLDITGTPTYIIGNEVIPGAVGIDDLRTRIANMRKCGDSVCS